MKIKGRRIKPDRIPLPTCMNRDPTSKLKSQLQYNKKMLSQCMFVPRLKKEKVDFRVLGGCRERGDNIYSISIYNMTKLKIFSLIFCIPYMNTTTLWRRRCCVSGRFRKAKCVSIRPSVHVSPPRHFYL